MAAAGVKGKTTSVKLEVHTYYFNRHDSLSFHAAAAIRVLVLPLRLSLLVAPGRPEGGRGLLGQSPRRHLSGPPGAGYWHRERCT